MVVEVNFNERIALKNAVHKQELDEAKELSDTLWLLVDKQKEVIDTMKYTIRMLHKKQLRVVK